METLDFAQLSKNGYNRVPVVREILADLDTPLSAYLKLAFGAYSYLLESVTGGDKWGRYSIIGLPSTRRIEVRDTQVSVIDGTRINTQHCDDPLQFIEDYAAKYRVYEPAGLPKYNGGLVGYFGYETIGLIETKLKKPAKSDAVGAPDILLMHSDEIVVFDNLSGKLFIIVHVDPADAQAKTQAKTRLDELHNQLAQAMPAEALPTHQPVELNEQDFTSSFGENAFKTAVKTCQQYVTDGDAMQIVLSQQLSAPFSATPMDLYRSLRSLNPSPYMYYLDLGDFHVVGASPEILVRVENDAVTVRPIAGTRKRGRDEAHDLAMEAELLNDPKELAEHLMLIDLGRNDVGRVAQTGSVNLTDKMIIERYSHVMHIVSNVEGKLLDGVSALDVLRATFPAGTVSGAPKIRAMEIIDELEPVKRGVYAGAVGYLGWSGALDVAIAIRTAVIKDNTLYVQAGAGVVYDSIPDLEWMETNNKARAIMKAAQLAEAGLDAERTHR